MREQLRKKDLKNKYKSNFLEVRKLINEFDPCGLLEGGSPEDEYDCLTEKLLIALRHNYKIEEIKSLILNEIEHHFGIPDLKTLKKPYKTRFYNNLDIFLNQIKTFANNI